MISNVLINLWLKQDDGGLLVWKQNPLDLVNCIFNDVFDYSAAMITTIIKGLIVSVYCPCIVVYVVLYYHLSKCRFLKYILKPDNQETRDAFKIVES